MTATTIPSHQFVTKPLRCNGTLSSAGCVLPLSGDLISRAVPSTFHGVLLYRSDFCAMSHTSNGGKSHSM